MNPIKWAEPYFKSAAWWAEPSGPPAPLLTHMDWARQQLPISDAIRAIACVDLNAAIHRCRIGKITLKSDARH